MRKEIDVNNALKYRSDLTEADLRKRSSRTAKRKKVKDSCSIDDGSTSKKSRMKSIRTDVEINVGEDKKKRSGATDIGSKSTKKVKVLDEFFINVRKKRRKNE